MKRVIILAYDFPPYNSVGAQRPHSWFKNFHKFGYYPVVITRHWDKNIQSQKDLLKGTSKTTSIECSDIGEINKVPFKPNLRDKLILKFGFEKYRFPRLILTFFYSIFDYFSFRVDSKSEIYKHACTLIQKNEPYAIIATGEPFILFRYAHRLSRKFNIPWVADYRDGWSDHYTIKDLNIFERILRKRFYSILEKKYINSSKFISTVSEPLKTRISIIHPQKNINLVLNGYDKVVKHKELKNEKFTIVYAGTIYKHQRLEVFLEGFSKFVQKESPNIQIVFYGLDFFPEQKNRLLGFSAAVNPYLVTTNKIPKSELINKLASSDLLLLLANENIDGSCAKLYDYLAVSRPVLLSVDDNSTLRNIINHTQAGYIAKKSEDICLILETLYNEWLNKNEIKWETKNIEFYSRENQAKEFTSLLNKF